MPTAISAAGTDGSRRDLLISPAIRKEWLIAAIGKKHVAMHMTAVLTILLSACGQGEEPKMSIEASGFSQKTEEALALFDNIQFYDISLDESAKCRKISVWVYPDGERLEAGKPRERWGI